MWSAATGAHCESVHARSSLKELHLPSELLWYLHTGEICGHWAQNRVPQQGSCKMWPAAADPCSMP